MIIHVLTGVLARLSLRQGRFSAGPDAVDISGWYFSRGVSYTFEPGVTLPAGGYIIVAQNNDHIMAEWISGRFDINRALIYGPYAGKLDNEGETIALCNALGEVVDEVDHQPGCPRAAARFWQAALTSRRCIVESGRHWPWKKSTKRESEKSWAPCGARRTSNVQRADLTISVKPKTSAMNSVSAVLKRHLLLVRSLGCMTAVFGFVSVSARYACIWRRI